jgi:hypothetical protein
MTMNVRLSEDAHNDTGYLCSDFRAGLTAFRWQWNSCAESSLEAALGPIMTGEQRRCGGSGPQHPRKQAFRRTPRRTWWSRVSPVFIRLGNPVHGD